MCVHVLAQASDSDAGVLKRMAEREAALGALAIDAAALKMPRLQVRCVVVHSRSSCWGRGGPRGLGQLRGSFRSASARGARRSDVIYHVGFWPPLTRIAPTSL